MAWHLASVWESIADAIPNAPALAQGEVRRTWREYEARAARIAGGFAAAGLTAGAKIGIYAYNSSQHLETYFGVFKLRGVPINVNYRYTEHELVYLLDNADAEALVFDAQFGARVAAIRERLPKLKLLIEIDDGSGAHLDGAVALETLIAAHVPLPRQSYSEDDLYMLYTGGTTGMPKGVMQRQGVLASGLSSLGFNIVFGPPPPEDAQAFVSLARTLAAEKRSPVCIPACPLMHGTGLWGAFAFLNLGGSVAIFRNEHFDAGALWSLAASERATAILIVGDAFARPMLTALEAAAAAKRSPDLSALKRIFSSGVMFSREVKEGLLRHVDITIFDAIGATEGVMGASSVSRSAPPGETARFTPFATTKVFGPDDKEVEPGSDQVGMVASGVTPIAYYKDEAKSAATFRVIDGVRYSFPGDFAKVAADGSLILLGRGSNCINTGGEKVFPEEVEEALKAYPDVEDCLVVGVPDERFGERVTAVLSTRPGCSVDDATLAAFARTRIAGYKLPRAFILVPQVRRAPNGKADYAWARSVAREAR